MRFHKTTPAESFKGTLPLSKTVETTWIL